MSKDNAKAQFKEIAEELRVDIRPTIMSEVAIKKVVWALNTSKKLSTYIDKMKSVSKEDLYDPEKEMILDHIKSLKKMDKEEGQSVVDALRAAVKNYEDEEELNRHLTYVLQTEPANALEESTEEQGIDVSVFDRILDGEYEEEEKQMSKEKKSDEVMVKNVVTGNEITLKKAEKLVSSPAFQECVTIAYDALRASKTFKEYLLILDNSKEENKAKLRTMLGNMKQKEVATLKPIIDEIIDVDVEEMDIKENLPTYDKNAFMAKTLTRDEMSLVMTRAVYESPELLKSIFKLYTKYPQLRVLANEMIEDGLVKDKKFNFTEEDQKAFEDGIRALEEDNGNIPVAQAESNAVSKTIRHVAEQTRKQKAVDKVLKTAARDLDLYDLTSHELEALIKAGRVKVGHVYPGYVNDKKYLMEVVIKGGFYAVELGDELSEVV